MSALEPWEREQRERNARALDAELHDADHAQARLDWQRVGKLGEWIIRDRREPDKVTAYAGELERLAARHGAQAVPPVSAAPSWLAPKLPGGSRP